MKTKTTAFLFILLIILISSLIIFSRPAITPTVNKIDTSKLTDSDSIKMRIKGTDKVLNLEVASSSEKHTKGLMFRTSIPENDGMIFVFDSSAPRAFWMQNTLISLDIIFLDENFKVIKIHKNTKTNQITETYPSGSPSKYVLETNAGWSSANNLNLNDIFEII